MLRRPSKNVLSFVMFVNHHCIVSSPWSMLQSLPKSQQCQADDWQDSIASEIAKSMQAKPNHIPLTLSTTATLLLTNTITHQVLICQHNHSCHCPHIQTQTWMWTTHVHVCICMWALRVRMRRVGVGDDVEDQMRVRRERWEYEHAHA